VLDEIKPGSWFVRAFDGARPEALVEEFGRGYRLTRWSLVERERTPLGVFTSPRQAETAWWRHRDSSAV
jgi:hypothetical protein